MTDRTRSPARSHVPRSEVILSGAAVLLQAGTFLHLSVLTGVLLTFSTCEKDRSHVSATGRDALIAAPVTVLSPFAAQASSAKMRLVLEKWMSVAV